MRARAGRAAVRAATTARGPAASTELSPEPGPRRRTPAPGCHGMTAAAAAVTGTVLILGSDHATIRRRARPTVTHWQAPGSGSLPLCQ